MKSVIKSFTLVITLIFAFILTSCGSQKESIKDSNLIIDNVDGTVTLKEVIDKTIVNQKIPNGIESISDGAFSGCSSLTSIGIPSSVTNIGERAFSACISLTSIEIPSSVTRIGHGAFLECSKLEEITLPFIGESRNTNQYLSYIFYYKLDYYIPASLKKVIISEGITSIPEYAFSYFEYLTDIEIPSSVTNIGERAFWNCSGLTNIEIPSSVTNIGDAAFWNCSGLTTIEIPSSVTNIGNVAFGCCSGLTSIEIPSSVTRIGQGAFEGCSRLEEITLPFIGESKESNSWLGYIFGNYKYYPEYYAPSSLKKVKIYEGITIIPDHSFYGLSSLTSIEIPSSVTSIGENAFEGCSSLKFNECDNALYLGNSNNSYLFLIDVIDNSIESCSINENCKCICSSAFSNCRSLTSIEIPSSVTSIGENAFSDCISLTSIEIPSSVTSIGENAFKGCIGLTRIVVDDNNTNYDSRGNCNAIIDTKTNSLIYGCITTIIPSSVTSIGKNAFYRWYTLKNIEIPSSVTSIGENAFYECFSLTSIEIPSSVTSIGGNAFSDCFSLTSIEIPSSVISIGARAFNGCSNLNIIYYHGNITDWSNITIGTSNESLTSATIYYYLDNEPSELGNYWHYVNGEPTIWKMECVI